MIVCYSMLLFVIGVVLLLELLSLCYWLVYDTSVCYCLLFLSLVSFCSLCCLCFWLVSLVAIIYVIIIDVIFYFPRLFLVHLHLV